MIYRADRRKYVRYNLNYNILHHKKGNEEWQFATSDNISLGGIKFVTSNRYSIGDVIELSIRFPSSSLIMNPIKASVIWTEKMNQDGTLFTIGVQIKYFQKNKEDGVIFQPEFTYCL